MALPRLRRLLLACAGAALVGAGTAAAGVAVGYCTDDLEKAKAAGFDYAEIGVRNFARLSEQDFARLLERHADAGIPTPVGYLFLPTDLRLVGPDVDERAQTAYVRAAFARARKLGVELIVFGSGPARRVPDGYPRQDAFRQLVAFGKRIAPQARQHGIVLGVEAQRKEETNIVNSLAEALEWVEAVDHPSFQLIVDYYHLAVEKEDPGILRKAGKRIRHVHFANPTGRVFPLAADEYDYVAFFANLRRIGYRGRISIEARSESFEQDAPRAIAFLRSALEPGPRALFLIGDSTVRNGNGDGANGQWGWGEPAARSSDPKRLRVVNRAIGGRSSRTFRSEGRWARVLNEMKPGDVLLVQFGHNDGGERFTGTRPRGSLKGTGDETETGTVELTGQQEVVHTYGWYLRQYVREARARGVIPVVCSPVPRKIWSDGRIVRSDGDYGRWAAEIARSEGVGFLDLNELVAQRYDALGPERVNGLFADEHTHTNAAGAELSAACAVAGLKRLQPRLFAGAFPAEARNSSAPPPVPIR